MKINHWYKQYYTNQYAMFIGESTLHPGFNEYGRWDGNILMTDNHSFRWDEVDDFTPIRNLLLNEAERRYSIGDIVWNNTNELIVDEITSNNFIVKDDMTVWIKCSNYLIQLYDGMEWVVPIDINDTSAQSRAIYQLYKSQK